jgi:ABC-type uncharacterized transport system substrate-binding protein
MVIAGAPRAQSGGRSPVLDVRRREFITLLGGAAAWPLAARAQQGNRMRRIGVLSNLAEDDLETRSRNAVVRQGLQELGWTEGRNVRIDYIFSLGNIARLRQYAAELVALAPDVILATGQEATGALQQVTRIVPIVFVLVPDPVGAPALLTASRTQAATSLDLRLGNTVSAQNGWNCSKRSRRA